MSLALNCKGSLLKIVSNCTDMVLSSSVQVSQESGELELKSLPQCGTKQVTSKKQIPKKAAATGAISPAEQWGSKASYRNGLPYLNIPGSSVPMCYIANLKDFLKQNEDS